MKKVVTICAVAMLAFVGTTDTAKADHCSSGYSSSGFSFGIGRPSYYSARPTYSNYYRSGSSYGGYGYSRPSAVYSRPGFSISIGSGYRSSFGRSHQGHRHNSFRSFNRSSHRH
jgi:hypothetical protein